MGVGKYRFEYMACINCTCINCRARFQVYTMQSIAVCYCDFFLYSDTTNQSSASRMSCIQMHSLPMQCWLQIRLLPLLQSLQYIASLLILSSSNSFVAGMHLTILHVATSHHNLPIQDFRIVLLPEQHAKDAGTVHFTADSNSYFTRYFIYRLRQLSTHRLDILYTELRVQLRLQHPRKSEKKTFITFQLL